MISNPESSKTDHPLTLPFFPSHRNDRFVMETLAVSVEQGAVVAKADSHVAIIDMTTGKRADMPPEMLNAVTAFT